MRVVKKLKEWISIRKSLLDKSTGFVPTMGNLHAGHMSLFKRAKFENDISIASIYVNPFQFDQINDYDLYPRTLKNDMKLLQDANVDFLLLPDTKEIYADQYHFQVVENDVSLILEGEHRREHFVGVLTIILKLLNLTQPNRLYLGEKDYQQFLLIKNMINAFFLPVEIILCKTIRNSQGLALSSRHSRINAEQKRRVSVLHQLLASSLSNQEVGKRLRELGFKVDYITKKWQRRLGAVRVDDVRLIDNVSLKKNKN